MTDIDTLVALGEGITPGPWQEWEDGVGVGQYGEVPIVDPVMGGTREEACANARAIAAVPDLIAAIRILQTEKVELREAVVAARKIVMSDAEACRAFGAEGETSEPEIALRLIDAALSNTGEME